MAVPVPRTRAGRTSPWVPVVLVAAAMLLAGLSAAVVTPGLPYDEPAHWSNVLFIAEHARLPVLGEPGVFYEGQQAPLFYVVAAAFAGVTGDGAFWVVRALSVVGFGAMTLLTWLLLRRIARTDQVVVVVGTVFVAVNPMLIVMAGSVQNDVWAIVWGLAAMAVALHPLGRRWTTGLLIGVFVSLAVLTKISAAPLLIGLVIAYALRRRILESVVAIVVTAVLTGWWFIRNLVLYGDLTGQSAVALTGAEFENAGVTPWGLARTTLTYLTLPVEYVRNTIVAPWWVDVLAIVIGLALAVGAALIVTRDRRRYAGWPLLVVGVVAAASVIAWLTQVVFGWPVAFRTAYLSLPLFALLFGAATRLRPRAARLVGIGLVAVELVILVWAIVSLMVLPHESLLWS